MSKEKKGLGKLFAGIAIGAGLGVLFAPKKGSETRKDLMNKFEELKLKAKDIDIDEKIENLKAELADLDKEKVLKIAKKKAGQIRDMAEELVDYAVEKGTPVLEKAATAARNKAIDVTKEILEKLEKEK